MQRLYNRKERLGFLLETTGGTGIHVSEPKHFTVESGTCRSYLGLHEGEIRGILLSKKFRRKLLEYAKHMKINSGEVFITKNVRSLPRNRFGRR